MATFLEAGLALTNAGLSAIADALMRPMRSWPPLLSLAIISLLTAVALLPVIRRTSNQPRIRATKRAIQAGLFEIRLFGDDPLAVLRSFGDVLALNVRYLGLSLVPLLWVAVPLAFAMPQLEAFYGYGGVMPGTATLITVERSTADSPMTLTVPPQVRLETGAVSLMGSPDVIWRVVPLEAGTFALTVHDGDRRIDKTLTAGTMADRKSPRRARPGFMNQLRYPSERPLPDGSIAAVSVRYPEPGLDLFGWRVHWLLAYLVMSMACAFVLAPRFGVAL